MQTFSKFASEVMTGIHSAVPTLDQLVWSYEDLESNALDYCREAGITASLGQTWFVHPPPPTVPFKFCLCLRGSLVIVKHVLLNQAINNLIFLQLVYNSVVTAFPFLLFLHVFGGFVYEQGKYLLN